MQSESEMSVFSSSRASAKLDLVTCFTGHFGAVFAAAVAVKKRFSDIGSCGDSLLDVLIMFFLLMFCFRKLLSLI